ncbi:putative bifunctional diguanylate cyclase/phosphodiesterase [Herbaspirillum sp. GCM10030257]|uniref:putative bifunctional diguanylate cyclase/phosphodiesterase n=1 Tax=Herbaspirillum sp. GCM10030257 TaxID=3273393 RepID=UPI00361F74BF
MKTPSRLVKTSSCPSEEPCSAVISLNRTTRALRTLSAGNQVLLYMHEEQALLDGMCRAIVEKGEYHSASVGYDSGDNQKTLRWMACIGVDKQLLDELRYTWADDEHGHTATGDAIRTGRAIVGRNLLQDHVYGHQSFTKLRQDAQRRGYAAAAAFPLTVEGKILGALALHAVEADAFNKEEVELLAELAANLSYGIENLRTRAREQQLQATLTYLAYFDSLTGLPNRESFFTKLNDEVANSGTDHGRIAVLQICLRAVAEIAKIFGFKAGDLLLQEISGRMQSCIERRYNIARVTDNGFAISVPITNDREELTVVNRLLEHLNRVTEVSGMLIEPRAVIGIAIYPEHGQCAEALLRRASVAADDAENLSQAFAYYSGGQEEINARRLSLMVDLRRTIEQDQLLLYLQPKVDMVSKRICGAEALVRWNHPRLGMVATAEFIGLAEQTGLITFLTQWVLKTVVMQVHTWRCEGIRYPIAVNLSAQDVGDPHFMDRIHALFKQWDIDSTQIQFELTEGALLDSPSEGLRTLEKLKQMNSRLYIDDFGTGYSGLSYLQRLPVDSIKIDQSFVRPLLANHDSAVIVRSAIELGHSLGLEVIAEGVESQSVWDELADMGCDVAQGHFISRPIPAQEFTRWVTSRTTYS